MKKTRLLSTTASLLCLALGCAKGGTGTGNPGLTIASHGYNAAVARNSIFDLVLPNAVASTSSITSLSFCVTELRFITSTGSTISVPESQLGLIDLGDGSQTITWGKLTSVAQGTVISHVFVEIEHDHTLCPTVAYSVSANGQTITTELEFKFALSSPYSVPASGSVTFNLDMLVSKIDQAIQDGKFNNGQIGNYIDGSFEDSATGTDD